MIKWQRYQTLWDLLPRDIRKDLGSRDVFAQKYGDDYDEGGVTNRDQLERIFREEYWYAADRPYYRVYPCVLDIAEALREDSAVRFGFLPGINQESKGVRIQPVAVETPVESGVPPFLCTIVQGSDGSWRLDLTWDTNNDRDFLTDKIFLPDRPQTLAQMLAECVKIEDSDSDVRRRMTRLTFLLHMLSDPAINLLERIVLRRDAGKPVTDAILDRAARLQGVGFTVGRRLEEMPRRGRPHWGIRWCRPEHEGEVVGDWDGIAPDSRKGCVPKLRPIKGANEDFYRQVPTDFYDKEKHG